MELYHHGVKGQRWGVRRFQNEDGSLTDAGKRKYNKLSKKIDKLNSKNERNKSGLEEAVLRRKKQQSIYDRNVAYRDENESKIMEYDSLRKEAMDEMDTLMRKYSRSSTNFGQVYNNPAYKKAERRFTKIDEAHMRRVINRKDLDRSVKKAQKLLEKAYDDVSSYEYDIAENNMAVNRIRKKMDRLMTNKKS